MEIVDPSARDEIRSRRNPIRQAMRRGLYATLLAVAAAAPALAAPPELPAIVEPGSHETHIGKVIFVELVTPDLATAKPFYAGLFGWTYRDIPIAGGDAGRWEGSAAADEQRDRRPAQDQERHLGTSLLSVSGHSSKPNGAPEGSATTATFPP